LSKNAKGKKYSSPVKILIRPVGVRARSAMSLSTWVRSLKGRQDGLQRTPPPFSENVRAGKS